MEWLSYQSEGTDLVVDFAYYASEWASILRLRGLLMAFDAERYTSDQGELRYLFFERRMNDAGDKICFF
jgi:hypothetical protein